MPYPTADEKEVYKSPYKAFDIRTYVRIDTHVFTSPIRDDFSGTSLDASKWHSFNPSWGLLTIAGGIVQMGTSSPGISESYFTSKPNIWFPRSQAYDWTLKFRYRVNTFNGFGTFLDIGSLTQERAILRLAANSATGLSVELPARTGVINFGADTAWKTYKLVYTASSKTYELFIDEEGGGGFVSYGTLSAVRNRADYIVVGNAGVRQGTLSDWSIIELDYIENVGTSEEMVIPEWAGPQYLYDFLEYQNELWTELPTVMRGSIDIRKSNEADTLELDLLNLTDLDKSDPAVRLYTHFNFMNRFIKVLSRVNNGERWTPWRQIYLGSCDEKEIEEREDGSVVLTLRARDWVRKRLAETKVIRAYSDYGLAVEGLIMNKTVTEIIEDIAQNVCGLPYSSIDAPASPFNKPRTLNIASQPASQVTTDLMKGMAWYWKVDHTTGQVQLRPWDWGTDNPQYQLRTDEEVERVTWSQSSFDHTAQLEIGISNTEFQDGGFSLSHPPVPIPFYGSVELADSVVAQQDSQLYQPEITHRSWQATLRDLGSIRVSMSCQDWLEHDLEIEVEDDRFLGINMKDGPWLIDGYRHDWEGTISFKNELTLASQHPEEVVLDSLKGHV